MGRVQLRNHRPKLSALHLRGTDGLPCADVLAPPFCGPILDKCGCCCLFDFPDCINWVLNWQLDSPVFGAIIWGQIVHSSRAPGGNSWTGYAEHDVEMPNVPGGPDLFHRITNWVLFTLTPETCHFELIFNTQDITALQWDEDAFASGSYTNGNGFNLTVGPLNNVVYSGPPGHVTASGFSGDINSCESIFVPDPP